jgi:hypothetical protein
LCKLFSCCHKAGNYLHKFFFVFVWQKEVRRNHF